MEKKDLAWERYYDLSAQELGALINMAKMGKQLHKSVPASLVTSSTSVLPVSDMGLCLPCCSWHQCLPCQQYGPDNKHRASFSGVVIERDPCWGLATSSI